jgi:hypothetical protein
MRLALLLAVISSVLAAGCMDPLHDYKACVKVQKARCELRESCGLLSVDLETCYAYYEEFCRTRKMNGPGSDNLTDEMVDACVAAILTVPCEMLGPGIDETELVPECEFLQKPGEDTDTTPDAGEEDAGDEDSGPDPIPGGFL